MVLQLYVPLLLGAFATAVSKAQPIGPDAPELASIQVGDTSGACAITKSGVLFCYGYNHFGTLGSGDTSSRTANRYPEPSHYKDYSYWVSSPLPGYAQVELWENETPVDIQLGYEISCVLFKSGKLKCFGIQRYAGLGTSSFRGYPIRQHGDDLDIPYVDLGTNEPVKQLSLGWDHTCALLSNGQVKCFGSNVANQCGVGTTNSTEQGLQVIGDTKEEMGSNLTTLDLGVRTATKVFTHHTCTMVILDNGTVSSFGRCPGFQGGSQVSNIDFGEGLKVADIALSFSVACLLFENEKVTCFGENERDGPSDSVGLLGLELKGTKSLYVKDLNAENIKHVNFGKDRTVKKIASGYSHSCAILDNNKVKCWSDAGRFNQHLLGMKSADTLPIKMGDSLPYVDLGSGRTALDIVAYDGGTCALLDNNHMKCFGIQDYSKATAYLGMPDDFSFSDPSGLVGEQLPYVYFVQPAKPSQPLPTMWVAIIAVGASLCCFGLAVVLYKRHGARVGSDGTELKSTPDDVSLNSENPMYALEAANVKATE